MKSSLKSINPAVWLAFGVMLLIVGFFLGKSLATKDDKVHTTNNTQQSDIKPVMSVEAITPTIDTVQQEVTASGTITGQDIAEVGAKISGMAIDSVLVDVGDTVKKGQVLATLDARKVAAEISTSEAQIATATANLDKATSDLARISPLVEIGAISREQFESYKTAKINAEANLKSAKAQAYKASVAASDTQVLAPVSGIISQNNANVGMMTTGTTLFSIVKDGQLEWQAGIPADKIDQISPNQPVIIDTPNNAQNATGRVTHIAPTANATGEIVAFVKIDNPSVLRGGMYAQGRFISQLVPSPTLPIGVVTTTDGYSYVWVLSKDMPNKPKLADTLYYANRQKLTVVSTTDTAVVVDLPKQTLVVKQSGNFLNDGDIVRLVGTN